MIDWEKKYLATMIFCCKRLAKSNKAYYMVIGRDLGGDLLNKWDWLGFDRDDIPKNLSEIGKVG